MFNNSDLTNLISEELIFVSSYADIDYFSNCNMFWSIELNFSKLSPCNFSIFVNNTSYCFDKSVLKLYISSFIRAF